MADKHQARIAQDQDVREHCQVCGNPMIDGKAEVVCGECAHAAEDCREWGKR